MHIPACNACDILHMKKPTDIPAVLKALGDERRFRLIRLLSNEKELCVCELVDALDLPQYEVSRNLAALRKVGLVSDRRHGLWVYYFIPENVHRDPFIGGLLRLIRGQVSGPKTGASDLIRLKERLALRLGGECVLGLRQ